MFHDITQNTKKNYRIATPGVHVYFFRNISASLSFTVAHEKADLYVFGLYEGTGTDQFTLTTHQKHTVRDAKSHIIIKSILDGAARFHYDGIITLARKATGTDAALESRTLLLSDKTSVSAKPQLEILPADVRCTHAATISRINQEHTDFLRMRGLSQGAAETLLIKGFKDDLLNAVKELAPDAQISTSDEMAS